MNNINPAELLAKWMQDHDVRIDELQAASAYIHGRLGRVERLVGDTENRVPEKVERTGGSSLFVTVSEAAKLLGMTHGAFRRMAERGGIPSCFIIRLGKRCLRVDREALLKWVRSQAE